MMQIGGSKRARLGVLFSASEDADSSILLFLKAFEITASTYRFVRFLKEFHAMSLSYSRYAFEHMHSCSLKTCFEYTFVI